MSTKRQRYRMNKKRKDQEEALDSKTAFGISDPTPAAAIQNIRRDGNR